MFSILLPKNLIRGEEVQRDGSENDCACVHLHLLEFSREALCAFGLRRSCHAQSLMILCVFALGLSMSLLSVIPQKAPRSLKPQRAQCSTQPPDGTQVQSKGSKLWVSAPGRLCVQPPCLPLPLLPYSPPGGRGESVRASRVGGRKRPRPSGHCPHSMPCKPWLFWNMSTDKFMGVCML